MGIKPYLILNLAQTRYAIAAQAVTEIFLLPELTPVAEAPTDVVGLLNLHGQFVPVMHLSLRFGRQVEQCHLTDNVIVVESHDLKVGVIVHQVETVSDIDDRYIQTELTYGRQDINQAFIKGVINLDDEMILLLDVDNLIRHPDAYNELADSDHNTEITEVKLRQDNFSQQYFVDALPSTKEILRQRAINLQQATEDLTTTELIPIAVVNLAGRYFGIDLSTVKEFTKIGKITTIPCCPQYILGNMNLRGEILTLVDISQPLNLQLNHRDLATKAVVVEVDEIIAGIVVEEVYDVIDLLPEELKPIPVATNQDTAIYLKGVASYQDQTLNVIDLPRLLAQGIMTVELTA
ncbi:MAG: chemotaxis protein CheW [Cyanobacteria bacterium P01_A01_bin.83]